MLQLLGTQGVHISPEGNLSENLPALALISELFFKVNQVKTLSAGSPIRLRNISFTDFRKPLENLFGAALHFREGVMIPKEIPLGKFQYSTKDKCYLLGTDGAINPLLDLY